MEHDTKTLIDTDAKESALKELAAKIVDSRLDLFVYIQALDVNISKIIEPF